MRMAELKLKMIVDENPQLINFLDRSENHPSIEKISTIPLIRNISYPEKT